MLKNLLAWAGMGYNSRCDTHLSWSIPVLSVIVSNRPLSTPLGVCRNALQLAERGPVYGLD